MIKFGYLLLAIVVGMFIGGAIITGNLDRVDCITSSECFEVPITIGGSK